MFPTAISLPLLLYLSILFNLLSQFKDNLWNKEELYQVYSAILDFYIRPGKTYKLSLLQGFTILKIIVNFILCINFHGSLREKITQMVKVAFLRTFS